MFGLFTAFAFTSSGQNLYVGDTSAETQTDTLARGNYSTGLVPYFWDDTTAFDGKRSVRIDWDRKPRLVTANPTWYDKWISTSNSPELEEGQTYTFSFYAKASEDNFPINLKMFPCRWDYNVPEGNYNNDIKLSREWKRHWIVFTPKMKENSLEKSYAAILDFTDSPAGSVWYDAIQVEKAELQLHTKTQAR